MNELVGEPMLELIQLPLTEEATIRQWIPNNVSLYPMTVIELNDQLYLNAERTEFDIEHVSELGATLFVHVTTHNMRRPGCSYLTSVKRTNDDGVDYQVHIYFEYENT